MPTFWKRLLSTWCLWKKLLALWDSLSSETNTLLGVEDGTLPNEGLNTTSTTVDLVKSDLANDGRSMLPRGLLVRNTQAALIRHCLLAKLLDLLNLLWELLSEALLQGL